MKEIGKKQKIIGLITIILILVILAIVITKNITRNSQIENGGYFATTANSNSNLVSNYIKKGITIGGITGTFEVLDTLDATARPEDIAKGKTAYVDGVKITGTRELKLFEITGNETTNTVAQDKYENPITIPAGFKVVNPDDDVTKGIVIEDVSAKGTTEYTKGSQFVWIPVGDIKVDSKGTIVTINLGRYTFNSSGGEALIQSVENWMDTSEKVKISNCMELESSTYGNVTAKNLEYFIEKATINHGFYIGRYEAGDALATNSPRAGTIGVSYPDNPMVCKTGVYPYNLVNQSDASKLCQNMYSDTSNFTSDLINSYAWDTALVFIQKFSGDSNYSIQVGKNTKNALQKCGDSILASDNSKDVRCNVFDMAGNLYERSTETYCNMSNPCISRGGHWIIDYYHAYERTGLEVQHSDMNNAFRPILYL